MKLTTKDNVLFFMESCTASAALGAAMELGLFWLLEKKPLDATGVAQTLGIPINRCRYWLQLLSSIGLVEKISDNYVPSSAARKAVLNAYSQESWALLALEARQRFPEVCNLTPHIREPGSALAAQGLKPPDYIAQMNESPERARRFTRMLYEIHQSFADELAESLDVRGVNRLMDLGGGSGVMSLALLCRHPHLNAVVVDIANVCAAGREIAAENSMEERISYYAADFLHEELPTGFDMVLECDVGVYSETLFRKIRAALNPGGRLVVADIFAPEEGVAPPSRLHWAFHGSLEDPDFAFPTAAEIQAQLMKAGFKLLSESTLSRDWVVVEARK